MEAFVDNSFIGFVPELNLGKRLSKLKESLMFRVPVSISVAAAEHGAVQGSGGIHTRSKGPVPVEPNVQENIRENLP